MNGRQPGPDAPAQESPAPEGLVGSASELRAGEYVIYPGQGVHRVAGFERMDLGGLQLEVVKLEREHDGASVIVPVEKVPSTGLRRVAARELVEDVFHLLGAPGREVERDWKERHREIGHRLVAGGVLGVAEVVKELHALSQLRTPPPKEREQYDNARRLLVHEVAVSLAVPQGLAEDYVDHALTPPAGVKLPLRPPPKPTPTPARWGPPRREPGPPLEELEEELGLGGIAPEVSEPGAEGAPPGGEIGAAEGEGRPGAAAPGRARRGKRAARGEPARKPRRKKRAPKKSARGKRRAEKPGAAKRSVRKKRAAKSMPRARR